jgi:hypothetical protein
MDVPADDKPDDKHTASVKQKKSIRSVHQVLPENFVRGFQCQSRQEHMFNREIGT